MGKNKKKTRDDFLVPLSPPIKKLDNNGSTTQSGSVDDDDEETTELRLFLKWCHEQGFELNKKLKVTAQSCAGHGVITTALMEKKERLFVVPQKALLAWQNTDIQGILAQLPERKLDDASEESEEEEEDEDEDGEAGSRNNNSSRENIGKDSSENTGASPWTRLILAMMYEICRDDRESFWKPYLDVLPQDLDHPVLWTDQDLAHLEGTQAHRLAVENKAMTESEYTDHAAPFMRLHPEVFAPQTKHTLDLFKLVTSWVMAYSFTDSRLGVMMVPMADMLNHVTGKNNARLFIEGPTIEMFAVKEVQAAGELYNTYGDLAGPHIFAKYGFIEDGSNPHDFVELDMGMVIGVSIAAAVHMGRREGLPLRHRFLTEEDMVEDEPEGCYMIGMVGSKPECELLCEVTKTYLMTKDEFDKKHQTDVAGLAGVDEGVIDRLVGGPHAVLSEEEKAILNKDDGRRPYKKVLQILVGRKWKSYPTTVAQDRAALAVINTSSDKNSGRALSAARMRVLEKEFLASVEKAL